MNELINDIYGITEKNGRPVVSSKFVSSVFGKTHDNVLRDIRSLDCSKEFSSLNFEESNYKARGKKYPEILMTKDGFTFLVMGYRGKKAARYKEDYIKRFNQMEQFIKDIYEAKADFPEFTTAILGAHEEIKPWHFTNEIDMINRIVLGMSSKQFKEANNIEKANSIRPYLTNEQINGIKTLQRIDIGLIISMPDFQQRKSILQSQYERIQRKQISA